MRLRPGKLSGNLHLLQGGNLRIGGIDIVISAPSSAKLRIANPLYRPFLESRAGATRGGRMSARLLGDGWPSMQGMEKVFDTRDSWSLYRGGTSYWLSLVPPGRDIPLWVACFDQRVRRVDLYCQLGLRDIHGRRTIDLPLVYPLDQLLLMYYFARRKGILTHAAGLVRGCKAYLFPGASGAGKSTFSELLVAARAGRVLSDERMIMREIKGEIIAFGTPWAGTAGIARDGSAPLAGIFFLKHGRANGIKKLSAEEALERLLPVASIPWYDPDTAAPIIAFAKRVCAAVPCHEFCFTPDSSAIDFLREFIRKAS